MAYSEMALPLVLKTESGNRDWFPSQNRDSVNDLPLFDPGKTKEGIGSDHSRTHNYYNYIGLGYFFSGHQSTEDVDRLEVSSISLARGYGGIKQLRAL